MAWFVLWTLIHWIVIYPVDSVIQPLKNRGQVSVFLQNLTLISMYGCKTCSWADPGIGRIMQSWDQNYPVSSSGSCGLANCVRFWAHSMSDCQRLCRGETKHGLVHDVPYQNSLTLPIYRHIWKVLRFVEDGLPFKFSFLRSVRTYLSFWGKRS